MTCTPLESNRTHAHLIRSPTGASARAGDGWAPWLLALPLAAAPPPPLLSPAGGPGTGRPRGAGRTRRTAAPRGRAQPADQLATRACRLLAIAFRALRRLSHKYIQILPPSFQKLTTHFLPIVSAGSNSQRFKYVFLKTMIVSLFRSNPTPGVSPYFSFVQYHLFVKKIRQISQPI